MITCSICKHWRKIRDEDYKVSDDLIWPGPHGECGAISEYSTNVKAWTNLFLAPKDTRLPLSLENIEGEASLITKPDFSCSMGESK